MQVKLKKCRECGEEYKLYRSSLEPCPNSDCKKALIDKRNSKKSSSPIKKKRKRIKPISDSMAKKLVVYREVRDKYMKEHETCEFKGCYNDAQDLHHVRGRGAHLSDTNYFMAICRSCHTWVHENPKESRELGYLI